MKKTRFIPEGFKEFAPELGDYPKDMFACWVNLEQPHNPKAMFFIGKQSKPIWYYRFSDVVRMKDKIKTTISNLMSHEELKDKRKAERKEARKNMDISLVKVGDIYHWSGGYNCTKNDYVKVLEITGKNKVAVAGLDKTQHSGDWMNGEVMPVPEAMGAVQIFTVRPSGYTSGGIILRNTKTGYKENYYKWNGKPNWENCD
jgi:hypothetical protein